ncbi:hypothetical protein ACFL45_06660 [Candidatus Neomarinimicrobiota bacterium]
MKTKVVCLAAAILCAYLIMPDVADAQPRLDQPGTFNLNLARYNFRLTSSSLGVPGYSRNEHSGRFPNGSYYMWTVSNIKESVIFGEVILAAGEFQLGFDDETNGGYDDGGPFWRWEISKYAPPLVMVDGIQSSADYPNVVDESIKADIMFRVFKKNDPWMHLRYEGYQFVNQLYGDFVILKTTYKLTFDDDSYPETDPDPDADTTQVVKNVYIMKAYRVGQSSYTGKTGDDPSGSWFIHHGAWWASTMIIPSLPGVPGPRQNLVVTYGYDGDHPTDEYTVGGKPYNDTGHPRYQPVPDGWLMSTPYSGFTLLHCDQAPGDTTDWIEQPHSSRIYVTFNDFREWKNGGLWNNYIVGRPDPPYEILPYPPTGDPTQEEGKQPVQIWGGWPQMRMHDSVTVVHALGSGSITREEARAVGSAWAKWYQFGDVPEAYYDDPELGSVLVTDAIKEEIIHRGEDSLAVAMQRAQELWENNLVCPRPYPSPDLYVWSAPNAIRLEWTNVEEDYPGHEGGNVLAYRVYRKKGSFWDDFPEEAGKNLFWEMIKEIPADSLVRNDRSFFEYSDLNLPVGEDYYYGVTAVSDVRAGIDGTGPNLESSRWSNRSQLPAVPFQPGKSTLDSIVVVPNPYYIKGQLMNFVSDNNQLMFANLPPFCTLRIYNVTGDLVHKLEHDSGTSSEYWDQITLTNQFIASGVYILVATVTDKHMQMAADANVTVPDDLPGKTIIKFTIIR